MVKAQEEIRRNQHKWLPAHKTEKFYRELLMIRILKMLLQSYGHNS
jgi:hypothetical protein